MSQPQQSTLRNRLLKALSADDFARLQPHLEPIQTQLRQVLIAPHVPVTHVCFMESGFTSIVMQDAGHKVEVGLVGWEGLVGAAPVLLGSTSTPHEHFIQNAGAALRIDTQALLSVVGASPSLHSLLLRYVQTELIQARQTAFSNATYQLDARLARWLLMCHDRVAGDELTITHEFMSMMLGTQRSSVTLATQVLEGNHLIKAQRGRITVTNRQGLEALADGSYGTTEAEYARLIVGD
jgi:CRP-like cAMP-binding protein